MGQGTAATHRLGCRDAAVLEQAEAERTPWVGKASWWKGSRPDSLPHLCWGRRPMLGCDLRGKGEN